MVTPDAVLTVGLRISLQSWRHTQWRHTQNHKLLAAMGENVAQLWGMEQAARWFDIQQNDPLLQAVMKAQQLPQSQHRTRFALT